MFKGWSPDSHSPATGLGIDMGRHAGVEQRHLPLAAQYSARSKLIQGRCTAGDQLGGHLMDPASASSGMPGKRAGSAGTHYQDGRRPCPLCSRAAAIAVRAPKE